MSNGKHFRGFLCISALTLNGNPYSLSTTTKIEVIKKSLFRVLNDTKGKLSTEKKLEVINKETGFLLADSFQLSGAEYTMQVICLATVV